MKLLKTLNKNQKLAVSTIDGPIRIIAGPGSGKTKIITHRIANMIKKGIDPTSILALTFTNTAAQEMDKQLISLSGESAKKPFISTFHSFCAKLIRKNHAKISGIGKDYIIINATDQKTLINKIYKELYISPSQIDIDVILLFISHCKMNRTSVDEAYDNADNEIENQKAEIYDDYILHQQKNNSLDFDDLIITAVEVLANHEEVRKEYSNKFKYINIDEFQDTNRMQYELIKLLASEHKNLLVVGDPDQNIYSWTGADSNILLEFEKDYENTKTIYLNQNYRSTKSILNVATKFIDKNKRSFKRELFTRNPMGNPITLYGGYTEDDEAAWITTKISELLASGSAPKDILILYRASFISRSIEQSLMKHDLPFKVVGGVGFFERREIKIAFSYLRFSLQKDDVSFVQIISSPKRGIGDQKILTLKALAKKHKITLWKVITEFSGECGFSTKQTDSVKTFVEAFKSSPSDADKNFYKGFEELLQEVKYMGALQADNKNLARFENVKELIKSIELQCQLNPHLTTGKYISDIALDWIRETDESNAIQIMTIHKSKGLQFKEVFIMGLSKDVFPSYRITSDADLEEERRLLYVAITRGQDNVHLTYSKQKRASEFLVNIEPKYLTEASWHSKEITAEEKVMHDNFGEGYVLESDGEILKIDFGTEYGIKTLMANHKSLKRV